MKKFEEAELKVMTFENDIIVTSVINPGSDIPAGCACETACPGDGLLD